MSQESPINDNMSDWVGAKKAEDITRIDSSNIFRNAMAGRIPIRVKEGCVFYYKPVLETFMGAPIGNPDRIFTKDVSLNLKERAVFKGIRKEIEERFDDVIYGLVKKDGQMMLEISTHTEHGWSKLSLRKLSRVDKK